MIETSTALAELVARIATTARLGVDTEADSLHCYREKVCLVQVGLADADELVDPLAELDLSPLLDALSRTEIVLHGADFDLRMLYRLGLDAPGKIFDTMIAARLTGVTQFGYSALVAEHFGATLPKGSQKANWARRPLPPKIAQYARNDTHFLLPLAELLERRLEVLGRLTWLEQSCRRARAPCFALCGIGVRTRLAPSTGLRFTSCRTSISSTPRGVSIELRRYRFAAYAAFVAPASSVPRTMR